MTHTARALSSMRSSRPRKNCTLHPGRMCTGRPPPAAPLGPSGCVRASFEFILLVQPSQSSVHTNARIQTQQVNDTVPRDAFVHAGLKAFDASIFTLPLRNRSEVRASHLAFACVL